MDSTSIDRIFMRLRGLFGRGRVTYVDDSGPVQKMQVRMNGLITSDNRLRLAEFGFTSNPPIGADVLALHVAGDNGAGAVFATNHQQSRPKGLTAGESMLYSQDGKSVYITASGGIVVEAKGQAVTVNEATTVIINAAVGVVMNTPLLKVSGDILDNYGTNADTVARMRSIANGHTHPVVSIQTGGSTINTQPPTQQE